MKTKLIIILSILLLCSCKHKEQNEPPKEYTYVVSHSKGIDTIRAVDVYAERIGVRFYKDKLFGIESGKFDAPYSFKIIN